MKLELKHVSGYCQFGLKGKFFSRVDIVTEIDYQYNLISSLNYGSYHISDFKPILKSLSYLTKEELKSQGFWHHIDYLTNEKQNPLEAPFNMVQYLLSKHYDIYGLIEKGLAIDKDTIKLKK